MAMKFELVVMKLLNCHNARDEESVLKAVMRNKKIGIKRFIEIDVSAHNASASFQNRGKQSNHALLENQ